MELRVGILRVNASAALLCAAVLFFCGFESAASLIICAAVHELGHAAALGLCHCKIKYLRVTAMGCVMGCALGSYKSELAVALAGPAASVAFGLVSAVMSGYIAHGALTLLAGLSFVMGIFNLLPALPLDGGRALYALTAARFGDASAGLVTTISGIVTAGLLTALGIAALLRFKGGGGLLLCGIWLAIFYCKKSKNSIKSIK